MRVRRTNIIKGVFLCCCSFMIVFVIKSQRCLQYGECFSEDIKSVKERALWMWRRETSIGHGTEYDNEAECVKTILLYGMNPNIRTFCHFTEKTRYKPLIQFPKTFTCAEADCKVVLKYSEIAADIKDADIVAFTNTLQWMTAEMWDWAHGNRSEGQRWLFISRESPICSPGLRPPDKYIDTTYHWIASYKSDSEIYLPFGFYKPFPKPPNQEETDLREILLKKSKTVASMGSKCKSIHWDLKGFVKGLQELIDIDTFGDCSTIPIPWHDDAAVREMFGPYKFSLSLEESCCDDFITEKFWKSLEVGLVPVVVGASFSQYARIAPPSSFIHVDQFESMEELAVYLRFLTEHDEKYLNFHKWRNLGSVVTYNVDEKFVEPLMMDTHCSILQTYLTSNRSSENTIDHYGQRWGRSCSFCGYKWIQSFGRKARH